MSECLFCEDADDDAMVDVEIPRTSDGRLVAHGTIPDVVERMPGKAHADCWAAVQGYWYATVSWSANW